MKFLGKNFYQDDMELKINIAIDDVNPLKGYRILGEQPEIWLRKLNEDFGAKFTLFIPSNYHKQAPLSKHKDWVQELSSIEWLELAAHGHFHMTSDPKRFGECEFAELNFDSTIDRLTECQLEWENCDVKMPTGFRPPGWLINEDSKRAVEKYTDKEQGWFQYVAIHYEHNRGLEWKCKTFFGHDGIQQENISIHNGDMIMFQSHIAGNHNHNVWKEDNYNQLRMSLEYLTTNYDCEFKTLNEIK